MKFVIVARLDTKIVCWVVLSTRAYLIAWLDAPTMSTWEGRPQGLHVKRKAQDLHLVASQS